MTPHIWVLVRGALKEASDESVDVCVEGLSGYGHEVGETGDGVRADSRVGMFREYKEFGDHEVERELAVDFDIQFAWVIFAGFLESVEGSLHNELWRWERCGIKTRSDDFI